MEMDPGLRLAFAGKTKEGDAALNLLLPSKKLCHTGEGRCPSWKWIPAFAGKTTEGDAALNLLNASEH